jgi:hypothetical protein
LLLVALSPLKLTFNKLKIRSSPDVPQARFFSLNDEIPMIDASSPTTVSARPRHHQHPRAINSASRNVLEAKALLIFPVIYESLSRDSFLRDLETID